MIQSVKPKILLVDDEQDAREPMAVYLSRKLGYTVDSASNAYEALEKAKETTYDLVITDLQMPGMTGVAMLAEMRKKSPGLPAIIVSGADKENKEIPANIPFLRKPVDLTQLSDAINTVIGLEGDKTSPEAETMDRPGDEASMKWRGRHQGAASNTKKGPRL